MAELKEARVPDIGGYDDVPVIELLVAVGDVVKQDQGLVTLESDKATMEVPAPFAGTVRALQVKVGDKLSEGSVVALIEPAGDAAAATEAKPAPANDAKPATAPTPPPTTPVAETGERVEPVAASAQPDNIAKQSIASAPSASAPTAARAPLDDKPGIDAEALPPRSPPVAFDAEGLMPGKVPFASPAVRLFARELGVDLSNMQGTGPNARITKEDVQQFVKRALSGGGAPSAGVAPAGGGLDLLPWPHVDFSKFGETEVK